MLPLIFFELPLPLHNDTFAERMCLGNRTLPYVTALVMQCSCDHKPPQWTPCWHPVTFPQAEFLLGKSYYSDDSFGLAADHFEVAVDEFFTADKECKALCEGAYNYDGYNYMEYSADLFQTITGETLHPWLFCAERIHVKSWVFAEHLPLCKRVCVCQTTTCRYWTVSSTAQWSWP